MSVKLNMRPDEDWNARQVGVVRQKEDVGVSQSSFYLPQSTHFAPKRGRLHVR